MNSETFCFWLQGFVELSESNAVPNEKQWLMIKDHLKLVFDKKTPDRSNERDPLYTQKLADLLRPKPVDLVGKQWDENYWKLNPVQITC